MKKFAPALLALILVFLTATLAFPAPVRTIYGTPPTTLPEGTYTLLSGATATGDGTAYDLGMTVSRFTCSTTLAGQIPTNTVVKLKGSIDGTYYDDLATDTWTPSNYITDGTFTGSLSANWTAGAGWAYETNDVRKSAGTGTLTQAVAALAVVPQLGEKYLLNFTINPWTKGSPVITFMGGTGVGDTVTVAALYTRTITTTAATGALTFTPSASDDGYDLDTVVMIRNEHAFHVIDKPVRYIKGSYTSKSGGGSTTAVTLTCTAGGN